MGRARAGNRCPTKVWLNCTAYGNLSKTEKDDFSKGVGSKGMCNRTGKGINLWEKTAKGKTFSVRRRKQEIFTFARGLKQRTENVG